MVKELKIKKVKNKKKCKKLQMSIVREIEEIIKCIIIIQFFIYVIEELLQKKKTEKTREERNENETPNEILEERNENETTNEILERNENENQYIDFILRRSRKSCLIYAPTQVGKTNATKDFIKVCIENKVHVILSCDNKIDQLEQIYTRISNELDGYENLFMMKVSDNNFERKFENGFLENKIVIVFCLDNVTQINKVKKAFSIQTDNRLEQHSVINKIALVHDEADVITKGDDIKNINISSSESHNAWIELIDFFSNNNTELKRIFVTATPDNVVIKYEINYIICLQIPNDYIGYENIEYKELNNGGEIRDILIEEENRRLESGENGIILYCIDKKIAEGQKITFDSVCSYINSIVSMYNGKGITARVNNPEFKNKIEEYIERGKRENKIITCKNESTNTTRNVWNIKNMPIRDFYQICKEIGSKVVVTIGMDLIARGISFVSAEKTNDALAATTLIYKPGTTMHNVGLCQTIGRITGTARPDLKRVLYAPKDVLEDYKNNNENQRDYLLKLKIGLRTNPSTNTKELMKMHEMKHQLKRSFDRKITNIEKDIKYIQMTPRSDISRMKELLNMWWLADHKTGKTLRYVYESVGGVGKEELKEFLRNINSENPDGFYQHLVTNGKDYRYVFERNNDITKIRDEAIEYIQQELIN